MSAAIEIIAPERWGRDHYSLLLYVETQCVDNNGNLTRGHLRLDGKNYPSKLRNGEIAPVGHSDLSVLDDLVAAGLVTLVTSNSAQLTERGWAIAHAVRRARAESGRMPEAQINAMHEALSAHGVKAETRAARDVRLHEHESWEVQGEPGNWYCAACGQKVVTCGAVNPRKGWVCSDLPGHKQSKHRMILPNGDHYDWRDDS